MFMWCFEASALS